MANIYYTVRIALADHRDYGRFVPTNLIRDWYRSL